MTGHSNLDVLNRILHLASGKSYSIDYVREQIAEKLPQYADLIDTKKGSFYLVDAAKEKGSIRQTTKIPPLVFFPS